MDGYLTSVYYMLLPYSSYLNFILTTKWYIPRSNIILPLLSPPLITTNDQLSSNLFGGEFYGTSSYVIPLATQSWTLNSLIPSLSSLTLGSPTKATVCVESIQAVEGSTAGRLRSSPASV